MKSAKLFFHSIAHYFIPNISHKLILLKHWYKFYELKNINKEKRVICVFPYLGGFGNGIADRLKTCMCSYLIAKENSYNFYIYHDNGFDLRDYLIPNEVNWIIEKDQISRGFNRIQFLFSCKSIPKLSPNITEYHPHGYMDFFHNKTYRGNDNFHNLYNKLFKPTESLKNEVSLALSHANLTAFEYIAIHIRFLDFFEKNEPDRVPAGNDATSEEEKRNMITNIHKCIKKIHDIHKLPIVLFSDSNTFISLKHPEYVTTLPGKIGHSQRHIKDKEVILKTFIDLYIISMSRQAYNIVGPKLYASGFSLLASEIGGIPFERLEYITE